MKKFLQAIVDTFWNNEIRYQYKMAIKRGESVQKIDRIKSKLIKL